MAVIVFHSEPDDEDAYLQWLARHSGGYVINILRGFKPTGAKLHHATCRTISGQPAKGQRFIGDYWKICATTTAELDQLASGALGRVVDRCRVCHPAGPALQTLSTESTETAAATTDGRFIIEGPIPGNTVKAWADDYIRFEHLPQWQKDLRHEIRSRCAQLKPLPGQVLEATFHGTKPPNADVENLAIYNVDSFSTAGRYGIRFELGDTVPEGPNGTEYPYAYRYALAKKDDPFVHWQKERELASFDWIDVADLKAGKELAPVWLALWRGQVTTSQKVIAPDTPFGLSIEVRPPAGRRRVLGGMVKGVVDGVICALQTHTERPVSGTVLERLSLSLKVEPEEIEKYLCDPSRAVLGEVRRLVYPYRSGVKWDPSDHWCVAGQLLDVEPKPGETSWAIKGTVFELRLR